MSVQYKLYKISDNISNVPKEGLAPRMISRGMITLDYLTARISDASSLTKGDVYNVIINLREEIIDKLSMGYTVKIDGLGIFSLSIESRVVQKEEEIRSGSMKFKRVIFKAAKYLNTQMRKIDFERMASKI